MDANGRIKSISNKGFAVVYLAVMIVVLVAFVGLAVDIGYMYVAKGQLQNAADAGALAGVSKLRYGVPVLNQYSARAYAKTFAEKNKVVGEDVRVDLNDATNNIDGDICIGYWNGTEFSDIVPPGKNANAVKVVARRTSEPGAEGTGVSILNKPVPIFFGKVLNWNAMGAKAHAVAALSPAPILPIAVNEYWLATASLGLRPYGNDHDYPNSFVRTTNVNGSASTVFGKTFAVLGAAADVNVPSINMNGFVNLDNRSSQYEGTSSTWYSVNTTSTAPMDCSGCGSWFSASGVYDPSYGMVNSTKFESAFNYLMDVDNGYPYILPTAVREQYINPGYPTLSYTIYPTPTSDCSYATVAFFASSGAQPLQKKNTKNQYFEDIYPVGKKFIALVYDGSFKTDASAPNAVTIVGYILLQVDGYSNQNPKQLGNKNFYSGSGTSLYAHALENIVEPASLVTGTCDTSFFQRISELRYRGSNPKLVL